MSESHNFYARPISVTVSKNSDGGAYLKFYGGTDPDANNGHKIFTLFNAIKETVEATAKDYIGGTQLSCRMPNHDNHYSGSITINRTTPAAYTGDLLFDHVMSATGALAAQIDRDHDGKKPAGGRNNPNGWSEFLTARGAWNPSR